VGTTLAELKYSEASLEVALAPSRLAAAGLALMALATLAVVAVTPGPAALRILAATWVACAGLEALHTIALHRGERGVRSMRLGRAGEIEIRAGTGGQRSGVVRDRSFVAPWLTIIRWRPRGAWIDRTLLILPDMLPREDFRRLRVLLRWG